MNTSDLPEPGKPPEKLSRRADFEDLLGRARHAARRAADRHAAPADRSDLAQSVVNYLIRTASRLDYRGPTAFEALVKTKVKHKVRERLARKFGAKRDVRREVHLDAAGSSAAPAMQSGDPGQDPVLAAAGAELRERVLAALDRMPTRAREVVLLRVAGHTAAEVAAALGIGEANAQKIYTRARRALAELVFQGDVGE